MLYKPRNFHDHTGFLPAAAAADRARLATDRDFLAQPDACITTGLLREF
jgi:hypothetical protein